MTRRQATAVLVLGTALCMFGVGFPWLNLEASVPQSVGGLTTWQGIVLMVVVIVTTATFYYNAAEHRGAARIAAGIGSLTIFSLSATIWLPLLFHDYDSLRHAFFADAAGNISYGEGLFAVLFGGICYTAAALFLSPTITHAEEAELIDVPPDLDEAERDRLRAEILRRRHNR